MNLCLSQGCQTYQLTENHLAGKRMFNIALGHSSGAHFLHDFHTGRNDKWCLQKWNILLLTEPGIDRDKSLWEQIRPVGDFPWAGFVFIWGGGKKERDFPDSHNQIHAGPSCRWAINSYLKGCSCGQAFAPAGLTLLPITSKMVKINVKWGL